MALRPPLSPRGLCFQEDMLDIKLLTALIGIATGAFGYWFTTFSIQPILRYRNLRNKVLMDFIYYAQVINADVLNDEMKKLYRERILTNRKTSAELTAAILDLPCWYLSYLEFKGQKPAEAAQHLIGFSNTSEYDQAHKVQSLIRKQLGLPEES
jgi:hypothetical protein